MRTIKPMYPSREAFEDAQRAAIESRGLTPIRAQYDNRGDCFTCHESGRCPGWHTPDEEQAAKEKARAWMAAHVVPMQLPQGGI